MEEIKKIIIQALLSRADPSRDGDRQTCWKSAVALRVSLKGTVSPPLTSPETALGPSVLSLFTVAEAAAVLPVRVALFS